MGKFVAGAYIDEIVAKAAGAADPERAQKASDDKKWEDQLKKARAQGSLDRAFWIKKLREDKAAEKRKLRSEHGLEATTIIFYTWLKKWASQSKIVSTVITTLNKLLGLLVDVILMPFLPIIMGALIFLADAIIGFQDWWSKRFPDTTPEEMEGVKAGKKLSADTLGTFLGVDIPTAAAVIAAALLSAVVLALIAAAAGVSIPAWVVLLTAVAVAIVAAFLVDLAYKLGAAFGPTFGKFLTWLSDVGTAIGDFINGAALTFTNWMWGLSANLTILYNEVSTTFQNIIDIIIEKMSFGLIKAKGLENPQSTFNPPTKYQGWEGNKTSTVINNQQSTVNTNVGGDSWWMSLARNAMEAVL
jgi:hypothetical protein